MSVVPVNINGINQLSLNLAGTVTATTAAGVTTINQTGVGGGTPTGPAGGDLSGTYPNPAVAQVNGGVIPLNASVVGTNVSGQIVTFANPATSIAVQQEAYTYAADGGSANAYAVTLFPTPTIVAGSAVCFKAANTNTGASTLAVNGGSATAILKNGNSSPLAAGDITAGQIIDATFDGTVWQMIVPGNAASAVTSLTTIGSSGAASLSGNTLNIPIYAGGSGGGALTLLSTQSASSSANIAFTSVLSSAYNVYVVEFSNLVFATNAVGVIAQLSTDNGSTWDATNANYMGGSHFTRMDGSGSGDNSGQVGFAGAYLSDSYSTLQPGVSGRAEFYNSAAAVYRQFVYQMQGPGNAGGYYTHAGGAIWKNTSQANAIRFLASSGNIASGTISIFGLAH